MGTTTAKVYADIHAQATTLPRTLAFLEGLEVPSFVTQAGRSYIFTGCGSSYYAAQCAALLLRTIAGVPAWAVPSSEIWLLPDAWLGAHSVLVAISRSGATAEVVHALEQAWERHVPTITISLATGMPASTLSDFAIALTHVHEAARPMTLSFSNMLLAAQWLGARVAHAAGRDTRALDEGVRRVGDRIGDLLPMFDRRAAEIVDAGVAQYVFLGSGPLSGICAEASLKIQEMTQVATESYPTLEYRHGPIATLTDRSIILLLSCAPTSAFDQIVARDVHLLGGQAALVSPADVPLSVPAGTRTIILPPGLPDWLYGNIALPFFQLLAYHQAIRLGANPDAIRHLNKAVTPHVDAKVVELDTVLG